MFSPGPDDPASLPRHTPGASHVPGDGLPEVSPDAGEQECPLLDNIVPTRGYGLLPIVGLGGSAGGIAALTAFFQAMPAETGMAFVVILHLSPDHESSLPEMLGRATSMRVLKAEDGQKVEANTVYVIPPAKNLTSTDGHLRLTDLEPEKGRRMAVDTFFRTLADTHGPHSAAIVLSGADGDGAIGIKRIKERGGLTIAQDPDEAEHHSMPRTSIDTGMVDWVLPVAEMPARLLDYREKEKLLKLPPEEGPQPAAPPSATPDEDEKALRDVLTFLRTRTGRDFSYYKPATIVRRVSRRLQINGMTEMAGYLEFLRTHPGESGALLQDLLISVTNFFRDRDSFAELEKFVPSLFAGKKGGDAVRVWAPACATGEEAYTLAMLLQEHAALMDDPPTIQVFATDLSDEVIAAAREALYPATIAADVGEDRLRRFFVKEHRGYRVRRELRECVLFAVHDLLKDAPFSRLDLVSCRNLLIYLAREAQERALLIFQFALRSKGLLFLGSSEMVNEDGAQFAVVDKKHCIFMQIAPVRTSLPVPIGPGALARVLEARERTGPVVHGSAFAMTGVARRKQEAELSDAQHVSWEELHYKLIEQFAPPSLIVNREYEIMHVSESAGRFLHFSGGEPSMNLLRVIDPMLRVELRATLFRAAQSGASAEVFRVPVELEGRTMAVDIRVTPASEIAPQYLLVVLTPRESTGGAPAANQTPTSAEPALRLLEREIEQMKARLRDTVEQYEASTEDLKASNEELQAMNEELRSATEELETDREELQSINEELSTVNAELKAKVDELGHTNSDLANLMAATGLATIFLDRQLHITRYTPTAVTLFRLIASDVGRPLTDLSFGLNYPELRQDAERVLETLIPVRREVSDGKGRWFLAHVLPYRTADDWIAGAVLTFVENTEQRQAEIELRESEGRLRLAVEVGQIGTCDWNYPNGKMRWNEVRFHLYGMEPQDRLMELEEFFAVVHPEDRARVREAIRRGVEERGEHSEEYRVIHPDGSVRWIAETGLVVEWEGSKPLRVTSVLFDETKRHAAEEAIRESESRYRALVDHATVGVCELDLAGNLTLVNRMYAEILGRTQAELMGVNLRQLTHPDDLPECLTLFASTVETGQPWTMEKRMLRSDGQSVWVSDTNSLIVDAHGKGRGVAAIVVDVTERRQSQEALKVNEARLRSMFEQGTVGVGQSDEDGRITFVNQRFCEITGRTPEELSQLTIWDITHPDDRAGNRDLFTRMTTEGVPYVSEQRYVKPDGSEVWVNNRVNMVDDEGKRFAAAFVLDVTEQKRDRDRLRQSREELSAAFADAEKARAEAEGAGRAKDQFLAVFSHELRTPLTPVLMAVHMLSRRKNLPEKEREALTMIRRNVELEAHFVDDLLDITRISRGTLELVTASMDLHEISRHAADICLGDFKGKAQQLTISFDLAEPRMTGDASRLEQAIWNLLKNASKFSPEGGQIELRTRQEDGCLVLEVTDTGTGIEAGELPHIFDAFTQANSSIARRFGGLGLGLAIAKATVDAHGGSLTARSPGRDQGSTFTIRLPREPVPPTAS